MPKSTSHAERARYRLQRDPAFYERFVKDFARSGLTLPDYCRTHHVAESTYYRYLKQRHLKPSPKLTSTPSRFLPVRTSAAVGIDASCTLVFPNGCRLLLNALTPEVMTALAPFLMGAA